MIDMNQKRKDFPNVNARNEERNPSSNTVTTHIIIITGIDSIICIFQPLFALAGWKIHSQSIHCDRTINTGSPNRRHVTCKYKT